MVQCCTQAFCAPSVGQRAVCPTLSAPEHRDALATGFLSPLHGHSATSLCSLGEKVAAPWSVVPVSLTSSHSVGPSPSLLLSSFSFSCNCSRCIFVLEHLLTSRASSSHSAPAEEVPRHISFPSAFLPEVLTDYLNHNLLLSYVQTPDTSTGAGNREVEKYKEDFNCSPRHVRYWALEQGWEWATPPLRLPPDPTERLPDPQPPTPPTPPTPTLGRAGPELQKGLCRLSWHTETPLHLPSAL